MAAFETTLMAGSFVFGLSHAFEVDHMTAVSAFVATKPRPRAAAAFGAKWAIGHGISLLIFGSVLFALKIVVSPSVAAIFERLVGVALLALGVWTLYQLRRQLPEQSHHHHLLHSHVAGHEHGSVFRHGYRVHHHHGHGEHRHDGPIWMGVLHGIAGTAAFAGQAIVVASQSYFFVVLYTLVFSAGVLISMAAFAGVMGAVLRRAGRSVQVAMALWACAVGIVWLLGFGAG